MSRSKVFTIASIAAGGLAVVFVGVAAWTRNIIFGLVALALVFDCAILLLLSRNFASPK